MEPVTKLFDGFSLDSDLLAVTGNCLDIGWGRSAIPGLPCHVQRFGQGGHLLRSDEKSRERHQIWERFHAPG